MARKPKPELSIDFKQKMAGDLAERYPAVMASLDAALAATRTVNVTCSFCNHRTEAVVQDTRGAIEAARFLAEHGFGRPAAAETGDQERVIFRRVVVVSPGDPGIENAHTIVCATVSEAVDIATEIDRKVAAA